MLEKITILTSINPLKEGEDILPQINARAEAFSQAFNYSSLDNLAFVCSTIRYSTQMADAVSSRINAKYKTSKLADCCRIRNYEALLAILEKSSHALLVASKAYAQDFASWLFFDVLQHRKIGEMIFLEDSNAVEISFSEKSYRIFLEV